MIKYTIVLINMFALLFVHSFLTDDVNVKMNFNHDHLNKGDELIVSFTIHKGSIAGVGHMKQELPSVFSNATVIDSKGGEFRYLPEDNVIKFTWISLPADPDFTISYKVIVNKDAPDGRITLGGKFSYILNNEKQTFSLPDTSILIGNEVLLSTKNTSPTDSTTNTITKHDSTTTSTPLQQQTTVVKTGIPASDTNLATIHAVDTTTATTSASVAVVPTISAGTETAVIATRTIVGSPEAGTEFTVEISVKKAGRNGFARIQDDLPAGLTAMPLDNYGGTFSFSDQKVKIIWDNLPADKDIKASYRVMVAENVSGNNSITGTFSYVENDDPKKIIIPITAIFIKDKSAIAAIPNSEKEINKDTSTLTANNSTAADSNRTLSNNNTNTTTPTITATSQPAIIPVPDHAVDYKVQICALSKTQRGTSYFESKYLLHNKVSMEFHEGWKKYTVGKYDQYKGAHDYRETVRSKGIENPFVVAYNNGKRVTVQEALMITNQQWLR